MRNPELENRVQRIRRYIRKVLNQKRKEKSLKFSDITNILSIDKKIIKDYGLTRVNLDAAVFFIMCDMFEITLDEIREILNKI